MPTTKTYLEMIQLPTYEERFNYLSLSGFVGADTFGHDRYLNQVLYHSDEWSRIRRQVIIRDNSCDLAMEGYDILGRIIIHHINPITVDDIHSRNPLVFDMNNLVCVSHETHNAIHYGNFNSIADRELTTRKPGDTKLW